MHGSVGLEQRRSARPRLAPRPVPTPRALERLRLRTRYAWSNSADARLLAARRALESLDRGCRAAVSSGEPGSLTLGYAGIDEGFLNVLAFLEQQRERAGGGEARREEAGTSWKALAAGALPDADLVAVGCSSRRAAELPRERSLLLPFRLHLVVDVIGDAEAMRRTVSKSERWEFSRNRRRHDWAWEQDDDPRAFDLFYERMHLPTMERRHGARMRTEDKRVAYESIFRRGTLFFVSENGRRIAGALCLWEPATRTITTRLLGVLDGDDEHYASGAFKAVYHLLLEWSCSHGVEHVDFHGTEAFLSKGIFRWKRKFHPRVVLPPNHFADKRLWLHAARDTGAVRDFLVANPAFALAPDGRFEALYFCDRDRPAREDLCWKSPGVRDARRVDLDEFLAGAPGKEG
jgi:hypothetical protein